jgi:hypothetical protein
MEYRSGGVMECPPLLIRLMAHLSRLLTSPDKHIKSLFDRPCRVPEALCFNTPLLQPSITLSLPYSITPILHYSDPLSSTTISWTFRKPLVSNRRHTLSIRLSRCPSSYRPRPTILQAAGVQLA